MRRLRHLARWSLLLVAAAILLVLARRPGGSPEQRPLPAASASASGRQIGFDALGGFELELPEIVEDEQGLFVHANTPIMDKVPPGVRELDGERVSVSGFMQPITLRKGKVTEFLLLRDRDTCCFGGTPQVNHWIGVNLTNAPVAAKLGRPITVSGVLTVREIRAEGVIVGLYTMQADDVRDWTRNKIGAIPNGTNVGN